MRRYSRIMPLENITKQPLAQERMEVMAIMNFEDAAFEKAYGSDGTECVELLPGTVEGIQNYKYYLRAGARVTPPRYADKAVVLIFGKGRGYVAGTDGGFKIEELSFYAPDFENAEYYVYAVEDMEFIMCAADMNDYDRVRAGECRVHTPFFRTVRQCYGYDQSCKTAGTWSKSVLFGDFGRLGKLTIGVVHGGGSAEGGTIEKGHGEVHQWNYCVGNSDFTLTVEDEKVHQKAGDWSFVPAGLDHSLCAEEGKEVYYVWVELYTSEHGIYQTEGF